MDTSLRGGDAWEREVEGAIKICAHFLSVISENTTKRGEGFFRTEWTIALKRMRGMAPDLRFLIPVSIDGTSADDSARVPSEFLGVQWKRCPGGTDTTDLIADIQQRLGINSTKTPAGDGFHATAQVRSGLTSISTRTRLPDFPFPLVFGFILAANGKSRILVRAIGPSLARYGILGPLEDPKLEIYSGAMLVTANYGWAKLDPSSKEAVIRAANSVGAISLDENSRDAAIVLLLSPGSYTAQISSVSGKGGEVLFEFYQI
jgi:hypothetical protein